MVSFTVLESGASSSCEPFVLVDSADSREPVYSDDAPVVTETRHEGRPDVRELLGGQHYYTVYLPSTGAYMHVPQTGKLNSAFCWYAHNRGTRSPEELRAMRGSRAVVEYRGGRGGGGLGWRRSAGHLLRLLHWRNLLMVGGALGAYLVAQFTLQPPCVGELA